MSSNKFYMTRYIASGVKIDCRNLLQKFIDTQSVRYVEFVKIWRDMKFPCIYCGRESFAELYEFTEEVLNIAKEFFLLPNTLQTRLCGLYLLYGLYYRQPTVEDGEYLVKIRLSLKEWEDSCSLIELVREERHFDALYIFSKLLAENAFHFCALPREYGLEKSIRKYLEYGENKVENPLPQSSVLKLEDSGILKSLDDCTKKYYNFKCAVNKDSETEPHHLLNYVSPNITDDLRQMMKPVTLGVGVSAETDTAPSIGAHRRKLKHKACFGTGTSKTP